MQNLTVEAGREDGRVLLVGSEAIAAVVFYEKEKMAFYSSGFSTTPCKASKQESNLAENVANRLDLAVADVTLQRSNNGPFSIGRKSLSDAQVVGSISKSVGCPSPF